jgi:hypothetical protein
MVIMTARLLQIIVGLAGLCALVLGLLSWIANIDLTDIHLLFGLLVTLGLLVMSIIALTARGLRIWGMVGIVYAIILSIFGESQSNVLVGNLRLYDPGAAHAGRHRRDRADGRTRRALQDAEARRGAARSFISSAAALSFRVLKGRWAPHADRYMYVQRAKHREARKERRCNRFWCPAARED